MAAKPVVQDSLTLPKLNFCRDEKSRMNRLVLGVAADSPNCATRSVVNTGGLIVENLRRFLNGYPGQFIRERPGPHQTRPPSRFAANKKHAFLNWWPAAGSLCCKGNNSQTACRAKGPHGYAGAKARNDPNSRGVERNCQRSRPTARFRRADEAACQQAPYRPACQRWA